MDLSSLGHADLPCSCILSVPVMAIITKGDGLVTKKYDELRSRNVGVREARAQAVILAEEEFKLEIVPRLNSAKHPPAQCVFVRSECLCHRTYFRFLNTFSEIDMHKAESNCDEIVEKMAEAITDHTLQILFVSTQKNNVELCTKYAIREYVSLSSFTRNGKPT